MTAAETLPIETAPKSASAELRDAIVAALPTEDPGLNLIRRLRAGSSLDNFLQFFQCESSAFYSVGHDFIKASLKEESEISRDDVLNRVADFLHSAKSGCLPLLKTLATLHLPRHAKLEDTLVALTHRGEKKDIGLADHAAQVISFRYSHLIPRVLDSLTDGARDGLCFSRDPSVIKPLLRVWPLAADQVAPVRLGLLVAPQSIAHLLRSEPAVGFHLARSFGYLDDALDEPDAETLQALCDMLDQGLMTVDPCLIDEPLEQLRIRESNMLRSLFPWSMGMTAPAPDDFDPTSKTDMTLFFSAVRNVERANFDARMDENPHTLRGQENIKWTEYSRAPISYVRRQLATYPSEEFKRLGCPDELLPQYLFEHALCQLERDVQQQVEQKLFLSSRWALAGKSGQAPRAVLKFPIVETDDGLELTDLVLPRRPKLLPRLREPLSQGAESARKLLLFTQKPEMVEVLRRADQHFGSILPTVGIEIQCPIRDPENNKEREKERRVLSLPWKQALRSFDITSPRRPEYYDMVEASFRPALSYHAHAAAVLMLRELNFFHAGTDLALHVSLGGDLGPDVRYILFAQQFIMPPTNSPPGQKLFSKGFANLHTDSRNPFADEPNTIQPKHTELRSMRITIGDLLTAPTPACLSDVAAFQLLGGALASNNLRLQQVWGSFKTAIDTQVARLPAHFRDFLDANWYESSGDSSDRNLVPLLQIVMKRHAVRTWIREQQAGDDLRATFRAIRDEYTRAAFDSLPPSSVYRDFPQFFAEGAGGVPILNPDALKRAP